MAPAFARISYNALTLWLAGPQSSAAQPMPDGRRPEPGGWNRLVIEGDDLPLTVEALRGEGIVFRNDVVSGPGGQQIVLDDPAGNPGELFQAGGMIDSRVGCSRGGG